MAIEGLHVRSFIRAVTDRRKPHGLLWAAHPRVAIRPPRLLNRQRSWAGIGLNGFGSLWRARRYSAQTSVRSTRKMSLSAKPPILPLRSMTARDFCAWAILVLALATSYQGFT